MLELNAVKVMMFFPVHLVKKSATGGAENRQREDPQKTYDIQKATGFVEMGGFSKYLRTPLFFFQFLLF
jgi:hypothetical protein